MKRDKIIVIGAGFLSDEAKMAFTKLEKAGHEVVFVDSHKDAAMHGIGTTVNSEDAIKALESMRESKPRPLSEILMEDPKPFVLQNYHKHSLEPFVSINNQGPIGAILNSKHHKKRRK